MTRDWHPRPKEEDVRRVIEALILERFAEDEISTIRVAFAEDSDGSDFVEVRVVYAGDPPAASRTLPIGGELRRRFLEISEPAFPLVSFASRRDVEAKLSNETDD